MTNKGRTFKRTLTASVAVAMALLLGSCYWNPQSGAGKITLNLKSSSRAQIIPGNVQYARVYLYADNMNSEIEIGDGKPYAEAAMSPSGGSMTVDHVLAGTGYQLVLTLGSKPDGATFVPGQYGTSATFDVTANRNTDVNISSISQIALYNGNLLLSPATVTYFLLGKNLTGVAGLRGGNSEIYLTASDSQNLYASSIYSSPSWVFDATFPASGYTINSLSDKNATAFGEVWLNTTAGIREYDGSKILTPPGNLSVGSEPTINVLDSGSYYATLGQSVVYYIQAGGIGGNVQAASWYDVPLPLSKSGQAVLDFAVPSGNYNNAYFATAAGAFGIGYTLIGASSTHDLSWIAANGGFFSVVSNGTKRYVTSLAVQGISNLLVGTDDGVYQDLTANVDAGIGKGTTYIIQSSPLAATAGHPFRKLLYDGSTGYLAAVSNNFVIMYDLNNNSSILLPLPAVTIGETKSIDLFNDYTDGHSYLAVAGSQGLLVVQIP